MMLAKHVICTFAIDTLIFCISHCTLWYCKLVWFFDICYPCKLWFKTVNTNWNNQECYPSEYSCLFVMCKYDFMLLTWLCFSCVIEIQRTSLSNYLVFDVRFHLKKRWYFVFCLGNSLVFKQEWHNSDTVLRKTQCVFWKCV